MPWVISLLLDVSANTWDFWRYSESIQHKLCGIQVLPVSFLEGEVQGRRTTKTPRNSACIFPWKLTYCWWNKKNLAITRWYGNLSHDLQGSIHPNGGCPWDFWTINSSTWNLVGWKMMTCSFGFRPIFTAFFSFWECFYSFRTWILKNAIVILMGRHGTEKSNPWGKILFFSPLLGG